MSTTRYWVVGGEFRSAEFDALIDGTGRIWGPFGTHSDAESVWREESEQQRWSCCTRFTIVRENAVGAGQYRGRDDGRASSLLVVNDHAVEPNVPWTT
jgi:hypothetical protein